MSFDFVHLDELQGQARRLIRLRGPDARRFLQGTVTANVDRLALDRAVVCGLLTVKGKLVSEAILLATDDEGGVDMAVPVDTFDAVATLIDRHIIMDEVEVDTEVDDVIAFAYDDSDSGPDVAAGPGVRQVMTRHPGPGRLLVGSRAALDVALAPGRHQDIAAWNLFRVRTHSPGWGYELAPDFFPPEVGFVYAVDYDKGCYMGQEPLARIHARGQVQRVMVEVAADAAVSAPLDLTHPDRTDAGRLTTSVQDGSTMRGLAIVRRALAQPGTPLSTVGSDPVTVEVRSGPLGDDQGVAGKRR